MPGQVHEISVPLPHPALEGADWADGWKVTVSAPFANARQAAEAIVAAFPRWTNPLLALRQMLVLPLGLKGAGADHGTRDMIGIFPVVRELPGQLIAGFDDKHLDFRIVVDVIEEYGGQAVQLSTVIRRHNVSGKAYLMAVLPFHRAIIGGALSRLA